MAAPQYETTANFKKTVGITQSSADRDDAYTRALVSASVLFDKWTNTWWNFREHNVTIRGANAHLGGEFAVSNPNTRIRSSLELFMPARIITIDEIKEDTVLIPATDYFVESSWIEKLNGRAWSTERQGIVVKGDFGYPAGEVPEDVRQAVIEIAAAMTGARKKSFIQDDGIERTVALTTMPTYVQDIVDSNRFQNSNDQPFLLAAKT